MTLIKCCSIIIQSQNTIQVLALRTILIRIVTFKEKLIILDHQLSLNTLRFQRKPFQKSLIAIPTRSLQITEHLSPLMNKQPKTSSIANITLECREMRPEIPNFVSQKGGCNKEVEEGADVMNLIWSHTLYLSTSRIEGPFRGRKGINNASPIFVSNSRCIGISKIKNFSKHICFLQLSAYVSAVTSYIQFSSLGHIGCQHGQAGEQYLLFCLVNSKTKLCRNVDSPNREIFWL